MLLDAGHTIIEGRPSWFDVWEEALGAFDVTLDREALQKAYARASDALSHIPPEQFTPETWRQFLREMVANLEIPGHEDAIADRMHRILAEVRPQYSAYEEVPEVLERLRRRGLRLAVVSNWELDLPEVLARAGLDGRFDAVVASAAVGAAKPDPRIFHIALDRVGVAPSAAVHVGDSYEADVQGARAAGVHPVLLDRDRLYHDVDCDLIRNLRELPAVLDRLEAR
ncbi:MAG: HAD-IA family hydrolase [Armatimonadota bacterium]|nr:HAD-IA family hydrolase [Armatimonadota bacterium]